MGYIFFFPPFFISIFLLYSGSEKIYLVGRGVFASAPYGQHILRDFDDGIMRTMRHEDGDEFDDDKGYGEGW